MKLYDVLAILFIIGALGTEAGVIINKNQKKMPVFSGFKSNDLYQQRQFLKKQGHSEDDAYKVEFFCRKVFNKEARNQLDKKYVTQCHYADIEGYSGFYHKGK